MRKYPTILRCYARPEGGHFVAFCVDLCLADCGDTLQEAISALEENISLYLESLTAEELPRLFPRKASLWGYLDYYRVYSFVLISHLVKHLQKEFRIFFEPLKLYPRLANGSI